VDHFTSDIVGNALLPMRPSTYSTDGMYNDNHSEGVVGIAGIGGGNRYVEPTF
jgi:hypothetical protein